jgi:trehalose/maltose hydrolase-like predicted phosphorylase
MRNELFQYRYSNPEFSGMRCFLGNGYQSTEISNNLGQGAGLCNFSQSPFPIMRLAGVYSYPSTIPDRKKRITLPLDTIFRQLNIFGIFPLDPNNPKHPDAEDLDFYMPKSFEQVLDVRRATVTTTAQIEELNVENELFLSRTFPNFGAMKMKVSKSNGSMFSFQHITRKDPYTCYNNVKFTDSGDGKALWELKIPEDNYDFLKRGLYNIAQVTGIEILDDKNNPIKFKVDRTSEDTEKLDFNEMPKWTATVQCDSPRISSDNKYHWTIILYFGVYKQSDNETPRFSNTSSEEDQGKRAIEGLKNVMKIGYDKLLKDHEAAWQRDIWQHVIEVPNADEKIQRMIISSFYVMGCTYLEGLAYGNGPNGINGHWWSGRTFWDHDLWVNCGIVLWAPELARSINMLRFTTLNGAIANRKRDVALFEKMGILKKFGLNITEGAKYCWESTTSGLERIPNSEETPNIQEHITCDVIHGMWLQYLVTQDREFLEKIAFPVVYQCALYLGQRVNKEADGKYHFRYVLCADEFANEKNDNAFTNLYIEKCMGIAIEWCKLLGKPYPDHWNEIRSNMKYHFDQKNMRIREHETYKNEMIKQADTDLLTWPLEHPILYGEGGETIRRNNMLFYFSRLPENHIMMSACIFSIIGLELDMREKAWEYFSDQFPHFHPDLSYIPSESPKNDCWPFITGIGGFLSNLIYGFGGIRLREDGLLFDPRLDSKLPNLIFPRLKFQGIELRYEVKDGGDTFIVTNLSASKEFTLYCRDNRIYLPENATNVNLTQVKGRTEKKYKVQLPHDVPVTITRKSN